MLPASSTWSLTAIAAASGVALLWIWKLFSNQPRMTLAKRQMRARLYAIRLFGDEPAIVLRAQGQLLVWTARYLAETIKPLLVASVPLLILYAAADNMFGHRPVRPGESVIVTARYPAGDDTHLDAVLAGRGATVETPGVRIPEKREVSWRVRVLTSQPTILLQDLGGGIAKEIHCGHGLALAVQFWDRRPAVDVGCPAATLDVLGAGIDWRVWFVLINLVTMMALRRRFDVVF